MRRRAKQKQRDPNDLREIVESLAIQSSRLQYEAYELVVKISRIDVGAVKDMPDAMEAIQAAITTSKAAMKRLQQSQERFGESGIPTCWAE